MILQKNKINIFLLILVSMLLFTFYGCSTGRDGDEIIQDEIVIKGTTTTHAADNGTIVLVSTSNPQVIVKAEEEKTFPSGAVIVLVERALYSQEIGAYGKDATNVYCLYGTYSDNGVEKKITETEKDVTLTIPNVFTSEYNEFILGYKEVNASDWQYTKLGDDGKAAVASSRYSLNRPSQFVITTRHINYCYTVFGVKPESKKFDDINSITFSAEPLKYAVDDNKAYTEDFKISSLIEAEKSVSMFNADDLQSELTFYTSSYAKSGILVDGKPASESVSLEKEFNGEYLHRITINRYAENNFSKSGNLATYSISVGVKGISKTAFPPEFNIKSTVTTDNKVVFAGEGRIKRHTEGEDAPDGLPIDVVMTVPASDTVAPVSTSIILNFSGAIEWSTKAKKLINISNEHQANVSYSAVISDDYKTLTITTDKPLDYGCSYNVVVEAGITGYKTHDYVKTASFEFCTEEGTPGKSSIKPAAGSKIGGYCVRNPEFVIDFEKPVADADEVKKSIRALRGSEVIDYNITFSQNNRVANLTFQSELTAGKHYSIAMTGSIKDIDSLDIIEFEPVAFTVFPDINLVETAPVNNQINVPVDTAIVLTLSDSITWNSSEANTFFSLKDAETDSDFPFTCAYDETSRVITIKPQGNLYYERKYKFSLKEGLGNEVTQQRLEGYSSGFKTAASGYTVATINAVDGYFQKTILPFVVYKDNPKMEIDFIKDLMDYNYASSTITILKNGVVDNWKRVWNGHKLELTPPDEQYEEGAIYKISMNDVLAANDNSLINPFVPQEFTSTLLFGHGNLDNPFRIYNLDDYNLIKKYKTAAFIFMNDIDFSGVSDYMPIGDFNAPFCGTLLGNGKLIKNLVIDNSDADADEGSFTGLIGMHSNGLIASLTLDSSCCIKGNSNVGGFAGAVISGSIEDCINNATIEGENGIGGIVGVCMTISIKNCINNGELIIEEDYQSNIGGIIGSCQQGEIVDCTNTVPINAPEASYIGGIVGYSDMTDIINCSNIGNITGNYTLGGIAGQVYYKNIINCENDGDITCTNKYSGNWVEIGGIAGRMNENCEMKYCRNSGNVSINELYDSKDVGGLTGELTGNSNILYSYNTGNVTGGTNTGGIAGYVSNNCSIKNCYNSGNVRGKDSVGGIGAGAYSTSIFIDSCFCVGSITGTNYVGGIWGSFGSGNTISNCYFEGSVDRISGSGFYFAGLAGNNSGGSLLNNFSTTNTVVLGADLTTSSLLQTSTGSCVYENNHVFDASQLAAYGYDTVIKGADWGEGSTWNDESTWKYFTDKLPELNLPE